MTQLESKLDGLIAMLERPREIMKEPIEHLETPSHSGSTTSNAGCPFSHQPTSLQLLQDDAQYASKSPMVDGHGERDDDQSCCSSIDSVAVENLLDRGIVTVEECDLYLKSFRQMNSYFPFVMINPRATVQSMIQDSPYLLLAVLVTGSLANKSLQITLDKEFRAALSHSVVLHGEKSLDVLQGLLVYIAWSVYPPRPIVTTDSSSIVLSTVV